MKWRTANRRRKQAARKTLLRSRMVIGKNRWKGKLRRVMEKFHRRHKTVYWSPKAGIQEWSVDEYHIMTELPKWVVAETFINPERYRK